MIRAILLAAGQSKRLKDENKLINNLKFDISFPSDFVLIKKNLKNNI